MDIRSTNPQVSSLQGYTRFITEFNLKQVTVTTKNLPILLNSPIIAKTVPEKLNRLLLALEMKSRFGGDEIQLNYESDFPLGFAQGQKEFRYLVAELDRMGLIHAAIDSRIENTVTILSSGWERIDQLKNQKIPTKQSFVAMAFRDDMNQIYEKGIRKAIEETGYESYRIDRQEHVELIPFKMLAEIRKSRFVVADFTHNINGVYLEAGFAIGLDIPVIWLCREDSFDETHFDIKQFNHIIYSNEDDLYEKLKTRIEAVIT